ncbi:MAG: response regulator [Ignavibacteriales bacterium]|nr:response regulator [Ignavibacteriales bacterium]
MSVINVLLADDDSTLGGILTKELRTFGFSVDFVENGADAISLLQKGKYDIAVLDIRMPKVDGFGVLSFIKKEYPATKTIMLTAYADLKHKIMSHDGGADEFMTKPYDLETLRYNIENLAHR